MCRPALEVADIFRDHGPAWRQTNAGHVSLGQMKVMSAIERCRTAALGGHVGRCANETCAHTVIAYNSCRNRHCPKCQGAAARQWLAEREAELLPVPYFHVVYTLPAQIGDIAYQNKAVIYDLLFKASAETTLTIAADPNHVGAAHMGCRADASPACTHDRAGWRPVAGRIEVDRVPTTLFFDRASSLGVVPQAVSGDVGCDPLRRPPAVLRRSGAARRQGCIQGLSGATAQDQLGGLRQAAVRRAQAGVALSVTLHPPHRDLQSPAAVRRQARRHLQVQGLSDRGGRPLQDDDAGDRRVHPALPDPRAAEGLPSHPTLWAARQRQPTRKHCARAPAARPADAPKRTRDTRSRARATPRAAASMPVLRQPHDHHRDFRARLRAEVPAHAAGGNQDRHVMMPSPSIYTYRNARHPCWLSAGTAQARIAALHSIAVTQPILSRYLQIARSHRRMGPCFAASRLRRPLQSNLCKPEPAAKSP